MTKFEASTVHVGMSPSLNGGSEIQLCEVSTGHIHVWAPSLTEVQKYSALNAVMQPKYAMKKCLFSTRDSHIIIVAALTLDCIPMGLEWGRRGLSDPRSSSSRLSMATGNSVGEEGAFSKGLLGLFFLFSSGARSKRDAKIGFIA